MPHTAKRRIRRESIEQSFNFVQAFIKQLWLTSSPGEAMTLAGGELNTWFDDARSLVVYRRIDSSTVERSELVETRVGMQTEFWPRRSVANTMAAAREHRELRDALDASRAGLQRMPDGGHLYIANPISEAEPGKDVNFIQATVRTQHVIVGAYATHELEHVYSDIDRQVMGNMTEFLCFALPHSH